MREARKHLETRPQSFPNANNTNNTMPITWFLNWKEITWSFWLIEKIINCNFGCFCILHICMKIVAAVSNTMDATSHQSNSHRLIVFEKNLATSFDFLGCNTQQCSHCKILPCNRQYDAAMPHSFVLVPVPMAWLAALQNVHWVWQNINSCCRLMAFIFAMTQVHIAHAFDAATADT